MPTTHLDEQLADLDVRGSVYVGCTFTGLSGQRLDLRDQTFEDCRFVSCQMPLARVDGTRFTGTTMRSCDLMGIDWTPAGSDAFGLLEPLRFADCRMDYTNLSGLRLDEIVLHGCSLVEADLERASLVRADLRHADLTGARLGGADLSGADLTGAVGYALDPATTRLAGARVSVPEALSVLESLGLVVAEEGARLSPEAALDPR